LSGVPSVFELLRQKLSSEFDNNGSDEDDSDAEEETARRSKLYTAKQIAKRVRKLKLLKTGAGSSAGGSGSNKLSGRQLEAMLVETRMAARQLLERRGPEGVQWLAYCLEQCMKSRSSGLSRGSSEAVSEWALVPVTEAHFEALETDEMDEVLHALQLRAPAKGAGEWIWRVGTDYTSAIAPALALLRSVLAEKDGIADGQDEGNAADKREDVEHESESKRDDESDEENSDEENEDIGLKKGKASNAAADDGESRNDSSNVGSDDDTAAKPSAKKRLKRRVVDSDSDDE
jgi:hypothetical protein